MICGIRSCSVRQTGGDMIYYLIFATLSSEYFALLVFSTYQV